MKKWFISLAAGLVVLAACQPEPVLTIDKTAIQFDSSGGSVSVYVTSNYEWKASSSSDNFAISPDGGAESGYAVVTALPNTSSDNRSAQILFSCTGKDVTVSQTPAAEKAIPGYAASSSFARAALSRQFPSSFSFSYASAVFPSACRRDASRQESSFGT